MKNVTFEIDPARKFYEPSSPPSIGFDKSSDQQIGLGIVRVVGEFLQRSGHRFEIGQDRLKLPRFYPHVAEQLRVASFRGAGDRRGQQRFGHVDSRVVECWLVEYQIGEARYPLERFQQE